MADEREPKLSQLYRELEALEPPAELDRRILAAAREREAAHAPLVVPAGRHRWYYSLAAAAVLVLAVAVTLHVERDRPDPENTATAPAPQTQQEPQSPAPAQPENLGARSEAFPSGPKPQAAPAEAPARAYTPDIPAPQSQMKDEARARVDSRQAREAEAAAAHAPAAAAGRVPPAAAVAAPPEKPERWIERIAELRSRGRHAEADKELAEFRRVYPNYPLSEVMRERVEGR